MDGRTAFRRHTGVIAAAIVPLLALAFAAAGARAETYRLPLLPSASDALREGMVRIVNHSDTAGQVTVTAIDDTGLAFGPVSLEIQAGQAIRFSSTDLERGNDALGIATGIGGGQGDWRLVLDTSLDIEPLAYVHTPDGFVDSLHDMLPRRSFYHRVTLLAPGAGLADGSAVRLINPTDAATDVVIFGVDDDNALAPGHVSIALPAGAARTVDARDLENGAPGLTGRLGDGSGDWQLLIFTDAAIEAMTVLAAASGPLANLSASRVEEGSVLLFLAAGNAMHAGRLRITNRSAAGEVRIHAVDDTGRSFGPVTLRMAGARTVTLSSSDLETGNAAKGLRIGLGSGEGDWRLALESDLNLDVSAYARSPDGVVSAAHNVAVAGFRRHHVPFFNPAAEAGQRSRLRLINLSEDPVRVMIRARDDSGGAAPEGPVNLTVASGASASVNAESLDNGARELAGRFGFGEGQGGWRLDVRADRDIQVMSLLETAAGHLTNLSTSPVRPMFLDPCIRGPADADGAVGPADADGDGVSDHCDTEPNTARTLRRCIDGSFVTDPNSNPGLVRGCRVLVAFANHRSQDDNLPADHALRQWGTGSQRQIDFWTGIEVHIGRVTGIRLAGTAAEPGGLTGAIPPEFGQLAGLRVLDLSGNALSGWIPWELGNLANLQTLNLSNNRLTGSIPAELTNLARLGELFLDSNRLTGSVPRGLWDRIMSRELTIRYRGNEILGFAPPPELGRRTVFSGSAADNGNAAHHSVAYYQGPLVWEWNWRDDPEEHLRPVLGRWAALAVRVDHEIPEPPPVITRVLDSQGSVLAERLGEAAPPTTESTGSGRWRTEYVFELPGSLYRAGHQVVHVIDPDDELAETDEGDNTGEPIRLYGTALAPVRVTFVPLHFPGDAPPVLDAEYLMSGIRAYLPVGDDYQAAIAPAHQSRATDLDGLLDEVTALWNAEGDRDEYYHGLYLYPWLGGDTRSPRTAGIAILNGNAAVSALYPSNVVPHDFGHNLNLLHPPGCSATSTDGLYPFREGGLGPVAGWDVKWRRYVSEADEGHTDVMSYCGRFEFVSAYHYRKALNYRMANHPARRTLAVQPLEWVALAAQGGLAAQGTTSAQQSPTTLEADAGGGLTVSGRIDSSGQWSLTHAQTTDRGPRAPDPDGPYTLILLDADGEELYREPLSANALSHGGEASWAARTPLPASPVRQVAILDPEGLEVLREELPALN